ncbi:MAG TPA: DUF4968 domain-containing protein, partial [Prolixibacteraceae bacterium]|nr:DUF4968 domain-containing protein [Prolixibacteraceae bacterium]
MKNLKLTLIALILMGLSFSVQAKVLSYKKDSDGVTCTLDKGLMKVKLCFDNMVEVKYTTLPLFIEKPSLVITNDFKTAPGFSVSENGNELVLTTSKLKVVINRQTNAIKYTDLAGNTVLAEDDQQNKVMTEATVAGIDVYNCSTQFLSPADEALYGLGCHPEDSLSINYKGRNQEMAIRYMTGSIPVMLSTKGYGLFWDNYSVS